MRRDGVKRANKREGRQEKAGNIVPEQITTAAEVKEQVALLPALTNLLTRMADDELILGHRDSEWLGMGPEIEEDVAFSSISQDEVGHAVFLYGLLADLLSTDRDALAFARSADERRNAVLVERDNGDWAFTIARHYFYDAFDHIRLEALRETSYLPLRQGVAKMLREETYHRLHVGTWFRSLAEAGGEALERLQAAIDAQWTDIDDLFDFGDSEDVLIECGVLEGSMREWKARWLEEVTATMTSVGLTVPGTVLTGAGTAELNAGRTHHTPDLATLLNTLSEVYDLEQGAVW